VMLGFGFRRNDEVLSGRLVKIISIEISSCGVKDHRMCNESRLQDNQGAGSIPEVAVFV
jgi:hypothetical protein